MCIVSGEDLSFYIYAVGFTKKNIYIFFFFEGKVFSTIGTLNKCWVIYITPWVHTITGVILLCYFILDS